LRYKCKLVESANKFNEQIYTQRAATEGHFLEGDFPVRGFPGGAGRLPEAMTRVHVPGPISQLPRTFIQRQLQICLPFFLGGASLCLCFNLSNTVPQLPPKKRREKVKSLVAGRTNLFPNFCSAFLGRWPLFLCRRKYFPLIPQAVCVCRWKLIQESDAGQVGWSWTAGPLVQDPT